MPGCKSIVSSRPWYHKSSLQTFSRARWFVQGSRTMGAKGLWKAPTRTLRSPLNVMLKWRSEVAPSLWERVAMPTWPHQTCASMAPKWPRFRIAELRTPTSQGTSAKSGSLGSASRRRRSRPLNTSAQQPWFTSRKHSTKANSRRGARFSEQMLAARGTKAFASMPQPWTLCQSAFSKGSPSPPKPNRQVPQRPPTATLGVGHESTRPAKGPSGSSRT
mmetsp:Transcript_4421/g.14182  ORF Transcript_4421/g.14182 Transcript_4421/m.14182 type:complete len:218 (-) Transcript_4421:900-1553(-)